MEAPYTGGIGRRRTSSQVKLYVGGDSPVNGRAEMTRSVLDGQGVAAQFERRLARGSDGRAFGLKGMMKYSSRASSPLAV